MEPSKKKYGFGGGVLWVWITGDEISEHFIVLAIKKVVRYYWFP
jgi:hypothetical protein